jgi:hypothetical protein
MFDPSLFVTVTLAKSLSAIRISGLNYEIAVAVNAEP